jgi:hypothetical protein
MVPRAQQLSGIDRHLKLHMTPATRASLLGAPSLHWPADLVERSLVLPARWLIMRLSAELRTVVARLQRKNPRCRVTIAAALASAHLPTFRSYGATIRGSPDTLTRALASAASAWGYSAAIFLSLITLHWHLHWHPHVICRVRQKPY